MLKKTFASNWKLKSAVIIGCGGWINEKIISIPSAINQASRNQRWDTWKNGTLIKKGEILCQKELNLEKNQKEKDKDKKRRIRVTCVLLSMARN